MKKFATPLHIQGTESDLKVLIPLLEKLGYVWDTRYQGYDSSYPSLITQYENKREGIGWWYEVQDRTPVPASNPDLVLALAAMVEGDEFDVGEYVVPISDYLSMGNKLLKIRSEDTGSKNERYFWVGIDHHVNKGWFTSENCKGRPEFRKATKEEIIEHFNKTTMSNNKKIIGYNLKPEVDRHMLNALGGDKSARRIKDEYEISLGSPVHNKAIKLGIVDAIFDPVYEPEKPKVEIVTLRCEGGTFEIEVSRAGIFYRPENRNLSHNALKEMINSTIFSETIGGYEFKPIITHIDSGCKKRVPIEDWEKVLEAYYELCNETRS